MKPAAFAAAIVAIAIATFCVFGQDGSERREAGAVFSPEQILLNMPVNSDYRCVGISLVAAALLEGESSADGLCDIPSDLGRQIYEAAFRKERVRFHTTLCLGEMRSPIQSHAALDALATAVADRYKQRHLELIATAEGRRKLQMAENNVLQNMAELDAVLDSDMDHIVALLVVGSRRFPDGSVKDTHHAILIAKTPTGNKVVYDPNDPGTPISCRFDSTAEGLTIAWTCRYRDTGQSTSQCYRIVETDKFFRTALARE